MGLHTAEQIARSKKDREEKAKRDAIRAADIAKRKADGTYKPYLGKKPTGRQPVYEEGDEEFERQEMDKFLKNGGSVVEFQAMWKAKEDEKKRQAREAQAKRDEERARELDERRKQKDPVGYAWSKAVTPALQTAGKLAKAGTNEILKLVGVDEKDAGNIVNNMEKFVTKGDLNALKDIGVAGVKEGLKKVGVNSSDAGKLAGAIEGVVKEGKVNDDGMDALKNVGKEQALKGLKTVYEESMASAEKRRKERERAGLPPEPEGKAGGGEGSLPSELKALRDELHALRGQLGGPGGIKPAAPPPAGPNPPVAAEQPLGPSTTSTPALSGSGRPKRRRPSTSSSGSSVDVENMRACAMPRIGNYHMDAGTMHMMGRNRVYGGGIGNFSASSMLKDALDKSMKPFAPVIEKAKSAAQGVMSSVEDVGRKVKPFADTVNEQVKRAGEATNIANATEYFVKQGYPPQSVAFLQKNGGEEVKSLKVRRAPIAKMLEYAFEAISMGTWFKAKKRVGYDKIFHLSLIVNDRYTVQKLADVSMTMKDADMPNSEFMDIPLKNGRLFIKDMMDRTLEAEGPKTFFTYHPFTNNCQHFIYSILQANGLLDGEAKIGNFIMQPVENLVKRMPDYTAAVLNTLTNFGAITGITGAGKPGMTGGSKPEDDRMGANYHPNGAVKVPQLVDANDMRRMLDAIRKFESEAEAGSKKEALVANVKKAEQLLADVLADRTSLANEKKFGEMYQLFRASRSLAQERMTGGAAEEDMPDPEVVKSRDRYYEERKQKIVDRMTNDVERIKRKFESSNELNGVMDRIVAEASAKRDGKFKLSEEQLFKLESKLHLDGIVKARDEWEDRQIEARRQN
jgi:hypothetical protein